MIDNNYLSKPKKINFVIGLGKSGFWAAKFLRSINKRVIVWESKGRNVNSEEAMCEMKAKIEM